MSHADVGPWDTTGASSGFGSSSNLHAGMGLASAPALSVIVSAAGTDVEAPQPVSALAQRAGNTLAQLLQLTNGINARRGSMITHEMPAGLASPTQQKQQLQLPNRRASAVGGRQGRLQRQQQQAARRSTWAENKDTTAAAAASPLMVALTAAVAAPSQADPTPVPVPPPSSAAYSQRGSLVASPRGAGAGVGGSARGSTDRFTTGASAARRFSAAAGIDPAVAFAPSSLSGAQAAQAIDAPDTTPSLRQALLHAAKVRALTPSYARRGGGVLVSAADLVPGVDLSTGRNAHLDPGPASPRHDASSSQGKGAPRVVMEEDGLARGQEYLAPRLRASRWSSQYGTLTEHKRAIANRAPKRPPRQSEFRQQLLRESAALEEGPGAAKSAPATSPAPVPALTAAPVLALPPGSGASATDADAGAVTVAGEDHSNIVARPQRKPSHVRTLTLDASAPPSALPETQAPAPTPDWKTVLLKPGSERSESEVTYLCSWLLSLPTPFFSKLSRDVLAGLARLVDLASFDEGSWIFRQGERGEHFYVVLEGRVAIVIDKTLKQGEIAGQREGERAAAAAAAAAAAQAQAVTSAAAEAAQSLLLRSPGGSSSSLSSPRPASAALLRSPAHGAGRPPPSASRRSSSTVPLMMLQLPSPSRPASASSLALRSPSAASAAAAAFASRRSSLPSNEPVVDEGSGDDDGDDDADGAEIAGSAASSRPASARQTLSPNARKLVRATQLLASMHRAKRRSGAMSVGGASPSSGGLEVAFAPSLSPPASSRGPSPGASPSQSRPRSGAHTPASLLTPQRSAATLLSPRQLQQQQQQGLVSGAPSPRVRPSSAMQLQSRPHSHAGSQASLLSPSSAAGGTGSAAAAHEIHSPLVSPSHSTGLGTPGGDGGSGDGGPILTHQQQELGLAPTESVVAEAGAGAGFGEVALASKTNTRQASVLVLPGHGDCICLCLHKHAYDVALRVAHEAQLNFKLSFARELFLFHRWSYEKLLQFSLCFLPAGGGEAQHFARGHRFYSQRQACDQVFFVVSGSVQIQFVDEGEASAPLLLHADDDGGGSSSGDSDGEGGGGALAVQGRAWIGASYIRDEGAEARRALQALQRAAEERERLRAARASAPRSTSLLRPASAHRSRKKHRRFRNVASRYMDSTASARQRAVMRAPSQRERDEARAIAADEEAERRADAAMGGGMGGAGGNSSSRWWTFDRGSSADDSGDSRFTTSSSESGSSSTDTSCSDDDAYTVARRAERKRSKLAARKARRLRRHRRGASAAAVYDGMAHVELPAGGSGVQASSFHAHMPADGATSYHFYKVKFDKKDFEGTPLGKEGAAKSIVDGERVLRVTLKPQLVRTPSGQGSGAKSAPAPHNQFDLFAGNSSCRYPSKHKHTWASSLAVDNRGGRHGRAGGGGGGGGGTTAAATDPRPQTRSIILRPASDPNFQNGFVYLSVFHPLNEAAILAHQAAHHGHMPAPAPTPQNAPELSGPPYELRVETLAAGSLGRGPWGSGGRARPPRVYQLATLGPLDMFGVEEIIVQHEAANLGASAGGGSGGTGSGTAGSLQHRSGLNYVELGRISTAVVASPGGARVFTMDRAQFMNHCRGNMLAELKVLLRKQLRRRARTMRKQMEIEAQTEAKVPAPRRYDLARPPRPTLPRARPKSAHPLSIDQHDPKQQQDGGTGTGAVVAAAAAPSAMQLLLAGPGGGTLDATEAAPFHHRPNLSGMSVLTQRERAALEQTFRRERDHAKLKATVMEKFYHRHPEAAELRQHGEDAEQAKGRLLLSPGGGGVPEGKKGHELWVLDPSEKVQARRRALLLRLQAEEQAEQSVHWKEDTTGTRVQSNTLRLVSPSSSGSGRPSTAPLHRLVAADPPAPPLLLMPAEAVDENASMVPAPTPRGELETLDALLPPDPGAGDGDDSSEPGLQLAHGLNPGTYRMLRLDEKAALAAQDKLALRLFGRKIDDYSTNAATAAVMAAGAQPGIASASPLAARKQAHQRTQSEHSAIRDGPVFGLSGSSPHAGTLSRHGARMAIDAGLRSHWQRERASLMSAVQRRALGHALSDREQPFADPSLQNPWIYIPSLYDSAAEDPALNQLAVQLGIPQPKPVAQPRDRGRAHRRVTFGPDGAPLLDEEAVELARIAQGLPDASTSTSRRMASPSENGGAGASNRPTVEEALRMAELRRAADAPGSNAPAVGAAAAEEKEQSGDSTASTSVPTRTQTPSRPSTASGSGSKTARAVVACPIADSLWQSDLAVLNSTRPPPRGTPFVARTELAHMANFVLFQPKQVRAPRDVPIKYRNKERMEKEAAMAREDQQLLMKTLAPQPDALAAPTTDPPATEDTSAAPTRRVAPGARPGSAPMFGSFARSVRAPAAPTQPSSSAAAADAPAANDAVQVESESATAHDSDNGGEDYSSTIFSLTQVGAQPQSLPTTHRPYPEAEQAPPQASNSHETALVLHPDVATAASPSGGAEEEEEEMAPTFPRRMTAAATAAAAGLFLVPAVVRPLDGLARHEENASEQSQKEAIVAFLREQRAGLTLTARINESERTTMGWGVSATARPHSAQAVLRATRRAHSATRPRRPPSIPSRTRPPVEAQALAHMELLRRKQAQAQAAKAAAYPRAFRSVGRRKDLAFFSPAALLTSDATVQRPPLHPRTQSRSRPASAATATAASVATLSASYDYDTGENLAEQSSAGAGVQAGADDPISSSLASLWGLSAPSSQQQHQQAYAHALAHLSSEQMAEWDRVDVVEEGERQQAVASYVENAEESKQPHPPQSPQPWLPSQPQPVLRYSASPPPHPRPSSAAGSAGRHTGASAQAPAPAPPAGPRPISAFPRPPSRTAPRGKVRPHSAVTGLTQMDE